MSGVFNIRYNSELHKRILQLVLAREQLSQRHMSRKWEKWKKDEDMWTAYIPETEANATRQFIRDSGTPQYVTVQIPYSYAIVMTAHTYWSSVFLSRNPVMQYMGRHGEAQSSEQKVEALIDYQIQIGNMLAPLYIWIMDSAKYGLGVLSSYWDDEEITVSQIEEDNESFLGIPVPFTSKKVRRIRRIPGYSGSKLFNVRPYDLRADPRVPICKLQEGEFCGRVVTVGWNEIIRRRDAGQYFNVEQLVRGKLSRMKVELGSQAMEMPDTGDLADSYHLVKDMGFFDLLEMFIEIVPNDWGLGSSKSPEKWFFTIADKDVILCAKPQGAYHNQFPFYIQEYEIDGYQLFKRSMFDILSGLNSNLTWLFDTHMQSVRKVVNDQIIVDPSKLVMKDVLDPKPGRLWRLRPEAYGTDPRMAAHQFQVTDVTQGHIRDSQVIMEIMQRIMGVTENIMGMVNPGGRKTATEIRTSSTLGVNRLKVNAEYNSAIGWSPLGRVLVQESQQNYNTTKKFRAAGLRSQDEIMEAMQGDGGWLTVTPEDILGFFDYVPVDGTMPIDRFALSNLYRELMVDSIKVPVVAQQLDFMKIIQTILELNGVRNFNKFRIKPQIIGDANATANAQRGNIVPIAGGTGAANPGPPGTGGVPTPRQVGGVGPTA